MPAHLPLCAVGVCCKSSVTDLKSGFLPINIEPSKARTLPLLLFFTPRKSVGHNSAFIFHYGWILYPMGHCGVREGGQRVSENTENESLSLLCFISNDVERDGYRREGKRDWRKLKAGAANMRQGGLLGETREELFIVNLHINDSFPSYDFSAAYNMLGTWMDGIKM